MMKILCTILISAMLGRWIYAETEILVPNAIPVVDAVLEHASIPTHDQWSKDSVEVLYRRLAGAYQAAQNSWETQKDKVVQ
jgi:hypothetical protein